MERSQVPMRSLRRIRLLLVQHISRNITTFTMAQATMTWMKILFLTPSMINLTMCFQSFLLREFFDSNFTESKVCYDFRARGGNESVGSFADSLRSIVERRRASENPADLPDEDSELNKLCEKAESYLAIDASEGKLTSKVIFNCNV